MNRTALDTQLSIYRETIGHFTYCADRALDLFEEGFTEPIAEDIIADYEECIIERDLPAGERAFLVEMIQSYIVKLIG